VRFASNPDSTLKTELTLTVMQGYQVVAVAPKSGTLLTAGQTVLLERLPEEAPTPQYWLADDEGASLDSQLNGGALAGITLGFSCSAITKRTESN